MSGQGLVKVDVREAVAVVELVNPPVNAMSDPLLEELDEVLAALDEDAESRAVVLTGSGDKAFAAGADLPSLRVAMDHPDELDEHTARTRRVLGRLDDLRQPTIAAIQATAVGGGLELALCCDLAIASEDARLGLPEVGLGLIPGAGGTQRMSRRVGVSKATELILTGRLVKATEAASLGLITGVATSGDALDDSVALARRLVAQPRLAVEGALRSIRAGADLVLAAGLEIERRAFLDALATEDAREGVDAFIARREPRFTHR